MTPEMVLWATLALASKHLVIDFPLQVPRHYKNKGTYGHLGGIEHAVLHGFGTFISLIYFTTGPFCALLALIDAVVHYHVDWAKMNINKAFGLGPTTHEQFWWLVGLDQYAHTVTYIFLIWLLI